MFFGGYRHAPEKVYLEDYVEVQRFTNGFVYLLHNGRWPGPLSCYYEKTYSKKSRSLNTLPLRCRRAWHILVSGSTKWVVVVVMWKRLDGCGVVWLGESFVGTVKRER